MAPADRRPFPLAPLLNAAARYHYVRCDAPLYVQRERPERRDEDAVWGHADGTVLGEEPHPPAQPRRILIDVCGLTYRKYETVRERGGLTDEQADQCATALGVHPTAIWGGLWWDVETKTLFEQVHSESTRGSENSRRASTRSPQALCG